MLADSVQAYLLRVVCEPEIAISGFKLESYWGVEADMQLPFGKVSRHVCLAMFNTLLLPAILLLLEHDLDSHSSNSKVFVSCVMLHSSD
jgi:hypothetical protein